MNSAQNTTNHMDKLPIEILLVMFSYLNPESIAAVSSVNIEYLLVAKDNALWEEKFKRHFPHLYIKLQPESIANWYAEFSTVYEEEYKALPTNIRQLFSFVKEGDVASLEGVLKLKDLDKTDINRVSLLDWAKKSNNQALLNCFYKIALKEYELNEHTVDTKKTDEKKRSILHWAILCHQQASDIELLILQGVDLNATLPHINHQQTIHTACKEGQLDIVKLLLEKQPSLLNHTDACGQTPVLWAASRGHSHVVRYLAVQGANLNLQSNNNVGDDSAGYTPLHWASKNGHAETANVLIEKNAQLNTPCAVGAQQQAIHIACMEGQLDVVKLLIEKQPALLNQIDACGQTPVLWAASRGHSHVVRYLAETGANLNLQSGNNVGDFAGYTPLHWASYNGHAETANVLIEKNAQLNTPCAVDAQQQAIHIACMEGQLDVVKLLIEKQPALLNQIDACGQTPVLWAASRGHSHVVRYLAEKGANLNLQSGNNAGNDSAGYTPLHWASKNSHTKTIRVLLEKQANIEALNHFNQTPVDVAEKESGYADELKLLDYSIKADRRPDDHFKKSFTIFGHTFNFGCCGKQKKEAATALKKVKFDGADKSCLDPHHEALNNGELKIRRESLGIK